VNSFQDRGNGQGPCGEQSVAARFARLPYVLGPFVVVTMNYPIIASVMRSQGLESVRSGGLKQRERYQSSFRMEYRFRH
jgi:hypothetical protein